MRREEATWLVGEFLLLALAACSSAEDPRVGAEGLARSLQKKVRCSPAGLSAFECVQCLSHESLADLPGWNSTSRTREGWQREQLSVLLLERLSDLSRPCNGGSARCDSYSECRSALRLEALGTTERLARLEHILRRVKAVYVPTRRNKCFTAEDVLGSIVPYETDREAYVEKVAAAVITHLSQGHCIEVGDAVTDFLEDLFKRYGDNSTEVMTQQGLERLLKKLRLASDEIAHGHSHGHDHDHEHGHDHDDHSHDSHEDGHDHHHNHEHSHDDHDHNHEHSHDDHDHNHEHRHDDHDHSHDHSHHDHEDQHSHQHSTHDSHQGNGTTADLTSTPPAVSTSTTGHTHDHSEHHDHVGQHVDPDDDHEEHKVDHQHQHQPVVQAPEKIPSSQPALSRRRRSVPPEPEHDNHNHTSSALKCWSPGELISQFGRSENGTISRHEFFHLCPALIQQAVSDVCRQGTQASHRPTTAELYGYGTLSVFVISLCSLMGVLLLPCLARHAYYYIMMGFIGLSFGTMTGDALLHLIPQVLGLHTHDGGHEGGGHSHHHHHDDEGLVPSYMWKQLGLIGAIYGLFVFEALSTIFGREENEGHGHSHLPKNIPGDLHMTKVSSKTESNVELAHCSSTPSLATEESPQAPVFKSRSLCCGMSTLAAMVIIGGAIHNVADGLAIGAAFSSGLKSGLSTSLAVFCHELPHEFGDFVVLISTGLGYRRALFLNFLSALAAFGGLYAGFLLGEEAAARDWILTVTAGIFLYVALVDMLPELKQYRGKSPFKMFVVKNLGVLGGIAFMSVIAIYEDKLNI